MSAPSEPVLGAACAVGSALTWTLTSLLVRRLHEHFSSLALSALRSTLGGVCLLAWVVAGPGVGTLTGIPARTLALLAVSIVFAIGIGDTAFFESSRSLGLARAMTISMTYPVASAALAAAFLDEPLTAPLAAGSALTLGGLALIVLSRDGAVTGPGRFWPGVGAASIASASWAVSVIVLKSALGEVDAVAAQAVRLPLAGLFLWALPWSWGAGPALRRMTASTLAVVLLLGGLTAISSVLFVVGVKYAGVAVATVLSSVSPLLALPIGLVLGERPGLPAVLGTAVTVAGVVVLQL